MDLNIDRTIADNDQRSNLLKGFKSTNDFENFLIKILVIIYLFFFRKIFRIRKEYEK